MQPYLMPLLGAALLGWGVWQGQQMAVEEDAQAGAEGDEEASA